MGLGSCRLRFCDVCLRAVVAGGVGSFAADVTGLDAVMEREFERERRGASATGFTRAAIFMLAVV